MLNAPNFGGRWHWEDAEKAGEVSNWREGRIRRRCIDLGTPKHGSFQAAGLHGGNDGKGSFTKLRKLDAFWVSS